MAQVVTNENMLELIQTRQVPEFKAPEAPSTPTNVDKATADAKETPKAEQQPRAADGKFAKTDESQAKPADQAAKAADDDDDVSQLSESVKKKIDKIVAKKHRAMKEAEEFGRDEARRALAAEARAAELQKQIDDLKKSEKSEGPDSSDGDEPKVEDFKTVGEYLKAVRAYDKAQERKRSESQKVEEAKSRQNEAIRTVQEQFAERVAVVAKEIPDYAEVIAQADWEVPHHIQAYIVDSEFGPKLGYELAKRPEEFQRIAKLSPVRALAELGKLEDRLFATKPEAAADKPTQATSTQVSRAPAPIQPLEGKTTVVAKDPSQMSFQELRALRIQQRAEGKWRV
jgi:hypothetical protein